MAVTRDLIERFKMRYNSDIASKTVANAIAKNGIKESSFNNNILREHNFNFSDSIKKAEITNQKKIRPLLDVRIIQCSQIKGNGKIKFKDI